jgi:NAD(P)-dependent dehydrogenase (short-subunit alcohol dehydrogenase family)
MYWTQKDMPDLTSSTAVVTGANSGIGYEVTRAFAQKGAHVVMACRNVKRAETAATQILKEFPDASLEIMRIDLIDLSSVRDFAHKFSERYQFLHILCNNAGIMLAPHVKTVDGFELHLGVNYLGHFALTGLLLNRLLATENARIVTMSSVAHHRGDINFDDVNWEKSYSRMGAYGRSKLANLLFTYELQRRLETVKSTVISVAAHPGWAATNLQSTGLHMGGGRLWRFVFKIGNPLFAQSAAMGALPVLYAATAEVNGGDYIGPGGWQEWGGYPEPVRSSDKSYDKKAAQMLWEISEEMTGVHYDL